MNAKILLHPPSSATNKPNYSDKTGWVIKLHGCHLGDKTAWAVLLKGNVALARSLCVSTLVCSIKSSVHPRTRGYSLLFITRVNKGGKTIV